MVEKPRVLLEEWLPIPQIGAESQRERGASSALPPLNFLHVWWARRPLTVSRAAILASLLPAWSDAWPDQLRKQFPTRDAYYAWFLKLIGIFGDPAGVRRVLTRAKEEQRKLGPNPYGYKRAFTFNPAPEQIESLHALLQDTWGTIDPGVMDVFAGGGSIPFESLRYGFTTYANELNPVASVILRATLEYPARFGPKLEPLILKYGRLLSDEVKRRLEPFFPVAPRENIFVYVWARTVACPYTGKSIPLTPNWWLVKGAKPIAVQPVFDSNASEATFRIVTGVAACAKASPDLGTIKGGNAISPWAQNQAVDGDYIKAEAQAGRMGQQLYAVGLKKKGGVEFRDVTDADREAIQRADLELQKRLPKWEEEGLVPRERYPEVTTDRRPLNYGMPTWGDFFSPRQLLAQCTAVEVLRDLRLEITQAEAPDIAKAVATYLGLVLDKAADYNSRMVRWDSTRNKIANTFDRHDFSFKWSHAEFDAAHNLFPWVVDQVADAVDGIVSLIDEGNQQLFANAVGASAADRLTITRGSAADISQVPDQSIGALVVDPPYYNNVQYAECSDFFYVWEKRTIGDLHPDLFTDELTNKDDEAVANQARFADMGRKKSLLAQEDYERKMEACFREMFRLLKNDGVLTVMFTHKKVEAWDTLGAALINAGFTVRSSWPVHTESQHSLHQAKKNAAASTILLTCRKRDHEDESVWWDDLKSTVRETAREKAEEYEQLGIRGVDLYIATFGPVLSVISEQWPVLTSEVDPKTNQPRALRPEAALEIAREEVIGLRKQGLLLGRTVDFDPVTDWYLMAWDAFRAEQFPADEARKLAIALGLDLEDTIIKTKRVVAKKSNHVMLQGPAGRRKRGMVDPDVDVFECVLDAAHTAMLVFDEDGARACTRWLRQRGMERDTQLRALFQAMANAIPVTKIKGAYIRPEMALLDRMNDALELEIVFPVEPVPNLEPAQATFLDGNADEAFQNSETEDEA
jgi:adenine-specific DNA methylase